MFLHYIKIAFRNMWKYKSQTLISVSGLAVGFTCFALATLWIVYEMSFDSFHKNAKQMYVVYTPSSRSQTGYSKVIPRPLASYLKQTFPEIVNATSLMPSNRGRMITVDGVEVPALIISADSSFLQMFDVKILEGNMDFLIPGSKKIAITEEKARQLFGNEHSIGKIVMTGIIENIICAVVSEMPGQSNYPFDFILGIHPNQTWYISYDNAIIELFPGTNIKAFEKKIYEHYTGEERENISKMKIKPLTELHYTDQDIEREVKFQHILIFAISGLLVILCSLFNYLTLFVSRFRIRQKELALRVVCGASERSLLTMLSVEFILTLAFAVALGCCLTQLVHKPFLTLSDIQMNLLSIYRESFMYVGNVILVSLFMFWCVLFFFRRRNLSLSIRRSNNNLFRKISIVVQLIISIGFAFCVIIILKQMYYLHHTNDLGFSFKNRSSFMVYEEVDMSPNISDGISKVMSSEIVLINQLKQIPEITEIVDASELSRLLPQSGRQSQVIGSWEDKSANAENISLERMAVSPSYIDFYDFQLVEGEMLTDSDPESTVLLNESAVKAFGWHNAVGKHFDDKYTVKGVIRHVCNFAPTLPAKPVCYFKPAPEIQTVIYSFNNTGTGDSKASIGRLVLIKYMEGTWNSSKEKIEQLADKFEIGNIYNDEEEYDKFFKSENALIKLLSVVSATCVLICVFGFVSLVSLTCEERRKEIAIRKINGATSGNILAIFAKEYFLLLIIGAVIAFSTGYFIMQRWLEQYVKQTSIPAWIYVSILFAMALVIILCVGWQVYKASVENPAEVIKSE